MCRRNMITCLTEFLYFLSVNNQYFVYTDTYHEDDILITYELNIFTYCRYEREYLGLVF